MSSRGRTQASTRHRPRQLTLLAAALAASLLGTTTRAQPLAATLDAQLSQQQVFDIPPQPLASALIAFARQSGIQLSADSRLLAERQSPGVQGHYSSSQALRQLLRGSGLRAKAGNGEHLLIEIAPGAQRSPAASTPLQTPDILVTATQPATGLKVLSRSSIEALPAGNGDITSLLRIHPNVQFDDSQLSSKTPGEIDPANISINGAHYWQNLFLVDGVGMNNDIDPAADNPVSMTDVPGRSQGLALDTDLLQEVRVYDSNVPASLGGFNGGVVEAVTRAPSQELHGKLSMQMARSEWTEYHIDQRQQADFENSTSAANQPEFEKLISRATLEGHLSEDFGLLGSFSRKTSSIPLRGYGSSYSTPGEGMDKEQSRQIDNYFIKASWRLNEALDADLSLTHAPQVNEYFIANSLDSATRIESGGDLASLRVNWRLPLATLQQTLAWSRLENSRDSEKNYYKGWRWSQSKNWSSATPSSSLLSAEGSYGDIEQRQSGFSYKLNADWNAFALFGLQHQVQSGLELSRQNVYYERLETFRYGSLINSSNACIESEWCSIGFTPAYPAAAGQAFRRLNTYDAGRIEFDTRAWALYLQDEMSLGRLTLRPGVRLDGDDYMDQRTLAPRLALEYDLFGDDRTRLIGGANRYYGRNLYSYRLNDGRATLFSYQTRASGAAAWSAPVRSVNSTRFSQLDIPYDDELTLGLEQVWLDTRFALKYVNRKGRDQIIRSQGRFLGLPSGDPTQLTTTYYTYANEGESEADVFSFTLRPLHNFALLGSSTQFELALDWTQVSRSHTDYAEAFGEAELLDQVILYDGKFIRYSERPADNFARPWTARLSSSTRLPQFNLTWSNLLRHRAGYRRIADSGRNVDYQGTPADVWEEQSFGSALIWDTRLAWELPTAAEQAVFVNLDVTNLLDRVAISDVSNADVPTYEVGRQFMVELGYRF